MEIPIICFAVLGVGVVGVAALQKLVKLFVSVHTPKSAAEIMRIADYFGPGEPKYTHLETTAVAKIVEELTKSVTDERGRRDRLIGERDSLADKNREAAEALLAVVESLQEN